MNFRARPLATGLLTPAFLALIGGAVACSSNESAPPSDAGAEASESACTVAKGAAVGQDCCAAHGSEACATGAFCAAYDGRKTTGCYANKSRTKGQSCASDIECEFTCDPATKTCAGPKAKAIVVARIGDGGHTPAECKLGSNVDWVTVGTFGPDAPVVDGEARDGRTITVQCAVSKSADKFDVTMRAAIGGGASVEVAGRFDPVDVAADAGPTVQNGVKGTYARGTESYTQSDCVMTFGSATMGIASGRFWGTLDCANIKDATSGQVCNAHATLRFENCAF
ncbi:MAG: hypothetical protein U0169_10615 [Polyangiaceae bacterium]